jgi:hypothetical protein
MTRYDFFVVHPITNAREYFTDIREANAYARKLAAELKLSVWRHDIRGGKSLFAY